ncbi:PTS acetylgalactosamine transporter subunit IIC [Erysipelothrix larvae]|uniref:PTS acetylgalactosamine transporter subunit IIC n=1 Tax=Erysipelothrix larvae TaxID=1514105 RepID=A0A120JTS9_9FIRM|nr:PTS sugar transporter subunit IIC [Erysipelothrix larvae]AMC93795.1 PTS acetylgalactosamine transporter subunit IIC [Erysipelothrix larvae]
MSFNVMQYILVFIVTFIVAIDQFSFLQSLYQPIVVGPVVGAILGDMNTGLIVGGTYQLITIGSMPIGGAQPPNAVIGGIMATVFAIAQNTVPAAAVGMAVPFALLGQYAVTTTFTIMSPLMSKADQYAAKADVKGITKINYISMGILGTLFGVVVMVAMAAGVASSDAIINFAANNSWVMAGLAVAGVMMRYVGFAILMKIMLSGELWGFYFMGFAFATILGAVKSLQGPALLILAMIGLAIAIYDFQTNTRMRDLTSGGGDDDGI